MPEELKPSYFEFIQDLKTQLDQNFIDEADKQIALNESA